MIWFFQPLVITGLCIVAIDDPAFVRVQKAADNGVFLIQRALYPSGQEMHRVQMQHRSMIGGPQCLGKGGFSAAAGA